MNTVIRMRVMVDHEDVIFRDLEMPSTANFGELHDLIQEAFAFDNSQMASFYVSNEDWEKGQEFTLVDMGEKNEKDEPILLMQDSLLKDVIFESGQKLLYVFDFFLMWCFYIDVVEIKTLEERVIVPRIAQSFGDAPDQNSKSPEISFEIEDELREDDDDEQDEYAEMFDILGLNDDFSEGRDH
jgi:hypothetical protein